MALQHNATYQGYPGTAGQLRWDAGLEPSSGYIDLNLEDVQKIIVNVKPIPWGGNLYPGLISIKASQAGAHGTVASSQGANGHNGPGFSNFGDLVLRTFDGQKTFHTPQTYRNIFIAEAGIEEIQRNLGRVREHAEGKIRVQLTDIRAYYKKHGALLQRFNVRRPGGEFDQVTMKRTGQTAGTSGTAGTSSGSVDTQVQGTPGTSPDETFTPWTAAEIMTFLFKMLPGSPDIHQFSDFMLDDLEPPVDIVGNGEPIVEWIGKLLQQYGYEAHLLPDSQTYLLPKMMTKADYGQIATAPDQWEAVSDVHYERKTSWIKNRPPAVSVIGKRRVRRVSLSYIPVFQNCDDGLIYRLSALPNAYGYSLDKVNKQLLIGHEKNFRDVPPKGTAKAFNRGAGLRKHAYRMYAPAIAFKEGQDRISLQDLQRIKFMPIKKCPVYLTEQSAWFGVIDDVHDNQRGDQGPFALVPPIVRGYRYGQGFFKDFRAIQDHFNALLNFIDRDLQWTQTMKQWVDFRVDHQILSKPMIDLQQASEFEGTKYHSVLKPELVFGLGMLDVGLATKSEIQKALDKNKAAEIMEFEEQAHLSLVNEAEKQHLDEMIRSTNSWRDKVQSEFSSYQQAFGAGSGVALKCQLPYGPIPRGNYTINTQTGILIFSEPAVRLDQPFLMDNDTGTVRADGAVTVTFGYELDSNTPMDWTSVSFVADESNPDEAPKAKCVSLCYPVAMPSHVEHASSLQLYEDQNGVPFNRDACITEASSYAKGILEVPHRVDGYTYELDGLRAAVLEGGVNSVQHTWGEDGLSYTHVMVNSPYARGPIPGRMKDAWVASVEDRRRIETRHGNEDQ